MSRQILEITLRLPDGRVLTGRGRSLPVAIERTYNEQGGADERRRVIMVEDLKRGHVGQDEHRYRGTFHAQVFSVYGDPIEAESPVVVEVAEHQRAMPGVAPSKTA